MISVKKTQNHMTNEQLLEHYQRMVDIYGDNLPNPEQEPIRFQYYVKLYKYYNMEQRNE